MYLPAARTCRSSAPATASAQKPRSSNSSGGLPTAHQPRPQQTPQAPTRAAARGRHRGTGCSVPSTALAHPALTPAPAPAHTLTPALQERIIAEEYGPEGEGERFKATLFIVMCNRLVTCTVAVVLLATSGQSMLPQAPIWNYAAVSGAPPRAPARCSTPCCVAARPAATHPAPPPPRTPRSPTPCVVQPTAHTDAARHRSNRVSSPSTLSRRLT